MLVSYRWLRELLPGFAATPADVAVALTGAGLAVDAIRTFGGGARACVVAEVRRVEPHPKRSGLRLVTVDRGGGEQRVVCGAPNVPEPGGLVVLAPLGAELPTFGVLTRRDIGGVTSEGMLCSEAELGLAESSDGLLVLAPGSAAPGTPLSELPAFAEDTIFELDITPNRPDALGHLGVARDLGALLGLPLVPPEGPPIVLERDASSDAWIAVRNDDLERCPHYGAAVVLGVQVGPSPAWLRYRLASLGVRPINNVVDITNLLLLEFGQPMHAFDLERVRGRQIIVRRAARGEPFTTLDGVARRLSDDDLVIADAEGPSALAGIMGGLDSEIRDTTRQVLLECAYFEPRGVHRAARRHGLHTESSHRFERGVDPAAISKVLSRAKGLLCELAQGRAVDPEVHARGSRPAPASIPLRAARLEALLGTAVPLAEAREVLSRLGFVIETESASELRVRPASFRPDVAREVDLIEEVARVRGLDRIPTRLPAIAPGTPRTSELLERRAAQVAADLGLSEALTYAFVSARDLERLAAPRPVVTLSNPLTEERSVMRTSLLPGLLEALRRARRHGETNVRVYSVGSLFLAAPRGPLGDAAQAARPRRAEDPLLPEERPAFAAVLAGSRPGYLAAKPEDLDVYDAKGVALELVERLTGIRPEARHAPADLQHLHPRGAAEVVVGDRAVGSFGPLHPDLVDAFDLGGGAFVVEIDLAAVEALGRRTPRYRPIPRLPAITRDLALELDEGVPVQQVQRTIESAAGPLCESVELFDVFKGGSVAAGKRSLAFHLVYRDPKARTAAEEARTLTDEEVDGQQARVIAAVAELGGQLRG